MNADAFTPCGLRAERRATIGQWPMVLGRHRPSAGSRPTHLSGEGSP